MKRPSAGLLVSVSAHAALAAALITGVSWPRPPAPSAAPSVDLVAVAAPTPIPASPAPAQASPPRVSPPPPAPSPTTTPTPASLPPPPVQPAPPATPQPRQLALAAPPRPAAPVPASSAPAASAPAASGAAPSAPSADWLRAIAAWFAAHRDYPQAARRAGEEGSVVLRLTLARDGAVLGVSLVESSGYRDLDAASLGVVRGAHLPAAPTADAPAEITLRVPIRYALEASD